MKTKNKVLALAEIAIVLCSMFLVALPGIAAAATEIYEAGPLDVFGNANEDDIIDMRDTTYIKLAIFGKKPKTKLADANYDGKVSMLDVGQTKLIILGKEKELTYVDIYGEAETVNKPIKRMVNTGWIGPRVIRNLGARDTLVALGSDSISKEPTFYPVMSKLPIVGTMNGGDLDYEAILGLKPDVVMTNMEATWNIKPELKSELKEKLKSIPIICLNMRQTETLSENVRTLGYIIDRKDEAEELAEWVEGYLFNIFISRTEGLLEDEKPQFYFERDINPYQAIASGSSYSQAVIWGGGRNILDEIIGPDDPGYVSYNYVDPEWVMEQNPEIIFIQSRGLGYKSDDPSKYAAIRKKLMDRPELAKVDAVKNGRVYCSEVTLMAGPSNIISTAYMAKLLHPGLFEDLDPEAMHQEYIDKFCYVDFDVYEHGVFFYPPPEEW
nr:iron(III) ABC transporter, solute-binding protein [uncultured archaeon]